MEGLPCYSADTATTLANYAKGDSKADIPPALRQVVLDIVRTGISCYPWKDLVALLEATFYECCQSYDLSIDDGNEELEHLVKSLHSFDEPPFTIQRMCELLVEPSTVYKTAAAWLFSFEKMVNVGLTERTLEGPEYDSAVAETDKAYRAVVAVARLGFASDEKMDEDAHAEVEETTEGVKENDGESEEMRVEDTPNEV